LYLRSADASTVESPTATTWSEDHGDRIALRDRDLRSADFLDARRAGED
jgi:hypothetical protein